MFALFVGLGEHPAVLRAYSGSITTGRAWVIICGTRDQTQVSNKHSTCLNVTPIQQLLFYRIFFKAMFHQTILLALKVHMPLLQNS